MTALRTLRAGAAAVVVVLAGGVGCAPPGFGGPSGGAFRLTGARTPAPEFVRGGNGCSQFGQTAPPRRSREIDAATTRVLLRLVMRRCVLEGVPVTSAEEARLAPLVATLADAGPGEARLRQFLDGARGVLDPNALGGSRLPRVEALVREATTRRAMLDGSEGAARPQPQLLAAPAPAGPGAPTELLQPEFTRGGGGCAQFGAADPGPVSAEARAMAAVVAQQLVVRRCVLEGVPVSGPEDDRLFPLVRDLAAGVGADLGDGPALRARYQRFLDQARPVLGADRAARVEAHVAAALRGA